MTKKELMMKIKNKGVWMVNGEGRFLKAWKENDSIILRAYCTNENGEWIAATYKKNENEIVIEEKDGQLSLRLTDGWIDLIDEASCASDHLADEEYRAGVTGAIKVENTLASAIDIETIDEEIAIFE